MKYEEIDLVLYAVFDLGLGPREAAEATGVPLEKVERVLEMHRASRHKREPPPAPPVEEVRRLYLRAR
jgi:NAD+ synthase